MTIAHRTLSSVFWGAHNGFDPDARRPCSQEAVRSEPQHHAASGTISCAPWEGLYMEHAEAAEPAVETGFPGSTELERFLATLMHGE
jgi:hypothetical protein